MDWYIIHVFSGAEEFVVKALNEKINKYSMQGQISEIVIPKENVIEIRDGKKVVSEKRSFPGYILVNMEMNDRTWHLVKGTPKVTGFVGSAKSPRDVPAISDAEVQRLTTQISEGSLKPKPKVQFEEGDQVRVIDGPFSNFNGTVEEVKPEKGKVRVLVSIFGRATPVELDFMQVEKT